MNPALCFTGADVVTPFRIISQGVIVLDGGVLDPEMTVAGGQVAWSRSGVLQGA